MQNLLMDSHCHLDMLDLTQFDGNLDLAIQAAQDNHIGYILNVCIHLEHFPNVLSIAKQYPNIYASVGVHPNETGGEDPSVERLVALAQHPKVVAIGETGLDYYRTEGDVAWQQERFRRHIRAAIEVNKPIIVHTREAREDTIKIMKEEGADQVGGVMHCFTETWEMAQQAMALNFYISLSGIVTFKNASELHELAKRVPLEKLLVETDAPYLAPVPFRGKKNQPAYVKHTAEFIAALKEIDIELLAEQTTKNCFDLFKLT